MNPPASGEVAADPREALARVKCSEKCGAGLESGLDLMVRDAVEGHRSIYGGQILDNCILRERSVSDVERRRPH